MPLNTQSLCFSGSLLSRGFWLYVWEISEGDRKIYYVGRTGDNSSRNASSPLARLGKHFDINPKVKANTLLRRLREANVNPITGYYDMIAIGPIFEEQETFEQHLPIRNVVATLEHELAKNLKVRGLTVVGSHHPSGPLDEGLFTEVLTIVNAKFFPQPAAQSFHREDSPRQAGSSLSCQTLDASRMKLDYHFTFEKD